MNIAIEHGHIFDGGIPLFKDTRALLIGIGNYENKDLSNWELDELCADTDAVELEQTLYEIGYSTANVKCLCNEEATKKNIGTELRALNEDGLRGRAQLVLVFWAGHGFTDGKGNNYVLPWDADLDKLDETALAVDKLAQHIFYVHAKHKAVFVDTCYSKPGRSLSRLWLDNLGRDLTNKVSAFFGASSQLAIEDDRGGILFSCLCDGLKGEEGSDDAGIVHLVRLMGSLQDAVARRADDAWRQGGTNDDNPQAPVVYFDGGSQVPIGLDCYKYLKTQFHSYADEIPESVKELAWVAIDKYWL